MYGNKEGKYAINIFGDDMTYEEVITLAMGLREIEYQDVAHCIPWPREHVIHLQHI